MTRRFRVEEDQRSIFLSIDLAIHPHACTHARYVTHHTQCMHMAQCLGFRVGEHPQPPIWSGAAGAKSKSEQICSPNLPQLLLPTLNLIYLIIWAGLKKMFEFIYERMNSFYGRMSSFSKRALLQRRSEALEHLTVWGPRGAKAYKNKHLWGPKLRKPYCVFGGPRHQEPY